MRLIVSWRTGKWRAGSQHLNYAPPLPISPLPGTIMKGISVQRDEILERLRERIVRFAASKLARDSAEDLAQEVLLVLHEKYPTLERVEDLEIGRASCRERV